jgi:hypothetical protein
MRYPKGSVHLERFKDKVILDFLAESRHATRSQLMQFVRYYYCEFNWPVFNWRVRRMVDAGLARKQALPMLNGDVLYSITRAGFHALKVLGSSIWAPRLIASQKLISPRFRMCLGSPAYGLH